MITNNQVTVAGIWCGQANIVAILAISMVRLIAIGSRNDATLSRPSLPRSRYRMSLRVDRNVSRSEQASVFNLGKIIAVVHSIVSIARNHMVAKRQK